MYGIPNMKLDKDVVRRRIALMKEAGIEFKTSVEIGVDISKEELEDAFDAIVLCTGSQNARDYLRRTYGLWYSFCNGLPN